MHENAIFFEKRDFAEWLKSEILRGLLCICVETNRANV